MNTIIGVGNVLLSDDGVGVHTVQYLQDHVIDNSHMSLIDAGTLSYELLDWLIGSDAVIIVDAADMGESPGTVRHFLGDEIENHFRHTPSRSVHQISLRDALNTARIMHQRPYQYALVGVQPSDLSWGSTLSSEVSKSMPAVIGAVLEILSGWGTSVEPLFTELIHRSRANYDH